MELKDKLDKVKENILNAQNKTGLYNEVEIIAVTKTHLYTHNSNKTYCFLCVKMYFVVL